MTRIGFPVRLEDKEEGIYGTGQIFYSFSFRCNCKTAGSFTYPVSQNWENLSLLLVQGTARENRHLWDTRQPVHTHHSWQRSCFATFVTLSVILQETVLPRWGSALKEAPEGLEGIFLICNFFYKVVKKLHFAVVEVLSLYNEQSKMPGSPRGTHYPTGRRL